MKKMYYNNYICQKLGKIENLKIKKNKREGKTSQQMHLRDIQNHIFKLKKK